MPIAVVCFTCGSKINAPDYAAGRRAKCPKCKTPLSIPVAGPPVAKRPSTFAGVDPFEQARLVRAENALRAAELADLVSATESGDKEDSNFQALNSRRPTHRSDVGDRGPGVLWHRESNRNALLVVCLALFLVVGGLLGVFAWRAHQGFPKDSPKPQEANGKPEQFEPRPKPPQSKPIPLTESQKAAAADGIKALGRIEAAVQVGVNFQNYGQLLIEVKAVVNEAERTLPDAEIRTSLREAMDAYKDALTVWNDKIRCGKFHREMGLRKEFGHAEIIERYKLPLVTVESFGKKEQMADHELAMQQIWAVGAEKLARARSFH